MSQRSTRAFRRLAYLAIIALCAGRLWDLAAQQATGEESIADPAVAAAIRHAETYRLLSEKEHGDIPAARAGLRELETACDRLKQGTLPPEDVRRIGNRITAIEDNLHDQISEASGTVAGVFPLNRFLTSRLFAESGPTAIYRLIDDPAIDATEDAAADLAAQLGELEKRSGQMAVVVAVYSPGQMGQDQARALEHAARRAFHGSPRFRLPTDFEVAEALAAGSGEKETPPTALDDFQAGQTTPAVEKRLLKAFGPRVLLVTIRQADIIADIYRYQTDGRILEANRPQEAFSTSGFACDRRNRLAWILWANAALLVISYVAYTLIVRMHSAVAGGDEWTTLLVLPLVAFVVGRTLPYAVSPLLGSIRLPPETPLLASFWVAGLAGLGFVALPLVAYWLVSPWFAELWPSLSPVNRGGALFAAMGTGIAAYLAGPLLVYSQHNPAFNVMLMGVSVVVSAYLIGRTLDYSDPLPLSLVFLPVLLAMFAGAALLRADTMWLGIAAASIFTTGAAVVVASAMHQAHRLRTGKGEFDPSLSAQPRMSGGIPSDVQDLTRRAESPDYQPSSAFDQAWDKMSAAVDGHCCQLGLFGFRGTGKTATAKAIAARLVQEWEQGGLCPALLSGICSPPMGEPISYAPFREALAQHFEVNLLAPPGPKMQQISQALGGLFGSVIPFGRILFPSPAGSGDTAARPDEINASIAWMLRRLSRTRPILLFLDDVQWLDDASAALVKYLLEEFPTGGDTPVAIILVTNSKACLADLGFDVSQYGIELTYPSLAQQAQILVGGVGLQAAVAEEILARTGSAQETDGGLLWPLQMVAKLARSGSLVRSEKGFTWASGAWPADFAIPAHMQAAIQEQWDGAAKYHSVLACAACGCVGREFHVSVIADALGRTRLDLLLVLDEIERTTGMVHDVRDRDDVYAFHSSLLLEVIRDKLDIAGQGAGNATVPQIVREYHGRLAIALQSALKISPSTLYEVANHFYAAGAQYAAQGVEYCLDAARSSAAGYDFRRARNYLEMAEECAQSSATGPPVEIEKQLIRCQEAQVAAQGEERAQAAAAGLAYLQEYPGSPARLVLAVARLCYDAGHRSHEPKWYEDAAQLCRQIVAHPASPTDEAEARHIMAVSQPSERRAERIAELRKAYGLLEHAATDDREASRWFAQIVTSLAKELSKGMADERSEAKRLFQCRLEMDAQGKLGDLRGTATAVAGLGRLEWYAEPKNVAAAEKHFAKNLEISEAIGDIIAQVKMHSLLGACALEKDDLEQALRHYQRSWELGGEPIDRCFAAAGLLRCYQRQNRPEPFDGIAQQFLDLLDRENIPIDCEGQLQAVVKTCPVESRDEAVRKLWEACRRNSPNPGRSES